MKFRKFRNLSRRRKFILGLAVIIILVLIAALAFGLFDKDKQNSQLDQQQKYYSQLTGNEVPQDVSERPILGIMIENSRQARPQTGLDSAGIVFEAVTEGGITRYLAMYQEDIPEIVGPVRSLRTHFLDWLMGFDASVAHVGGSGEALQLADSRKAKSLSQFKFSEPYYRDSSRAAPHNMYARTKGLTGLQNDQGHKTSQFESIPRKDDNPVNRPTSGDTSQTASKTPAEKPIAKISIDFSSALFKVEFRYSPETNSYTRYLDGEPHVDKATGKPITVKNLVVIKAKGLSAGLDVLGSGEALIFNDGKVEKAQWEQDGFKSRIKLVDANNNEIALLRGDSWFAGVATDRTVSY